MMSKWLYNYNRSHDSIDLPESFRDRDVLNAYRNFTNGILQLERHILTKDEYEEFEEFWKKLESQRKENNA